MNARKVDSQDRYSGEYFMCATPCPVGVSYRVGAVIQKDGFVKDKINIRLFGYVNGETQQFYSFEGKELANGQFSIHSLPDSKYEVEEGSSANFDLTIGTVQFILKGMDCEDLTFCKIGSRYYFDTQDQLINNIHPFTIYNQLLELGTPPDFALKMLYGKQYKDGYLFYLDTKNGSGMIAAFDDQSTGAKWGCYGTDIMGLNNVRQDYSTPETEKGARIGDGAANTTTILAGCTEEGIAARLCRDLGEEWFLPSQGELNLMYTNLFAKGYGRFTNDFYWSSSEISENDVLVLEFFHGNYHPFDDGNAYIYTQKNKSGRVRAARTFSGIKETAQKSIQGRLNEGETPKKIYDDLISTGASSEEALNKLYGKMYKGGIIFYLDTKDGTGMVAAYGDQSIKARWGCRETDIKGLNNAVLPIDSHGDWRNIFRHPTSPETEEGARIGDGAANTTAILAECTEEGIAARLCRTLGEEWFLPSLGELNLMYTNLCAKGHGRFAGEWYWSSTEDEDSHLAWCQLFSSGPSGQFKLSKDSHYIVRAARAF